MGCVVSSLVQLMCDPHCRSQHGFQSLVQKEWVTAGHRFYSRGNYHRDNDKEEVSGGRGGGRRESYLVVFVWGRPDNLVFSMKTQTFIHQMIIKSSQDIEEVINNDFYCKY